MPRPYLPPEERGGRKRFREDPSDGFRDGHNQKRSNRDYHPRREYTLSESWAHYSKEWKLMYGERKLTFAEFSEISDSIKSTLSHQVVREAKIRGYFRSAEKNPLPTWSSPTPDERPNTAAVANESTTSAAPSAAPQPTIPQPVTSSAMPIMNSRVEQQIVQPRKAVRLQPPTPPAIPTTNSRPGTQALKPATMARADLPINEAVRDALARKAAREQVFLQECQAKFIAEAIKLHDAVPKLTSLFSRSEIFDAQTFGKNAQPAFFDLQTVTAGLRLLTEWENKLDVYLADQILIIDRMKASGDHPILLAASEKIVDVYEQQTNLTAKARDLLGDILLIIDDGSSQLSKLEDDEE